MPNQAIQRSIVRWIHIAVSIPICGYIYTPFKDLHSFAPSIRCFFLPALALTGLWLWKGHLVRRLVARTAWGDKVAADERPHAILDWTSSAQHE